MIKENSTNYDVVTLFESLRKTLKTLIMSDKQHSKSNNNKVFWTKYGLIFYDNDEEPIYIIHNNTTAFRVTPGVINSKLQVHAPKGNLPDDWAVSLIEISHGIHLRSITPEEHLPKTTKLKEFADKIFVQVNNSKEDEWLIC